MSLLCYPVNQFVPEHVFWHLYPSLQWSQLTDTQLIRENKIFSICLDVVLIFPDGAANNIALDDPDFWTKVRGVCIGVC